MKQIYACKNGYFYARNEKLLNELLVKKGLKI